MAEVPGQLLYPRPTSSTANTRAASSQKGYPSADRTITFSIMATAAMLYGRGTRPAALSETNLIDGEYPGSKQSERLSQRRPHDNVQHHGNGGDAIWQRYQARCSIRDQPHRRRIPGQQAVRKAIPAPTAR